MKMYLKIKEEIVKQVLLGAGTCGRWEGRE
jgi:hypothetical protein